MKSLSGKMLSLDETVIVFIAAALLGCSFFSAVFENYFLLIAICLAAESVAVFLLRGRLNISMVYALWLVNIVIMFAYADTYRGTMICYNLLIVILVILGICMMSHPQDKTDLNKVMMRVALVFTWILVGFMMLDYVFKTRMLTLYAILLPGRFYYKKQFWMMYEHKYYGLCEYPNVLSMAGMIILCHAVFMMPPEKKKIRWFAIIISVIVIVLTGERSNLVIIPFAIIVARLIGAKNDRMELIIKVILVCIAAIVLIYLMQPFLMQFRAFERVFDSLAAVGDEGSDISNGRNGLYAAAIENWKRSPVIGNGWFYYYYNNTEFAIMGNTNVHTHNLVLELLSDLGLVGAVVFLFPMALTLAQNIIAVYTMDPEETGIMKLTLCIQIHFLIDSLFHVSFFSGSMISFYFFVVVIFQNALYLATRNRRKEKCIYFQNRPFGYEECNYLNRQVG